jgi:hypothetical protein
VLDEATFNNLAEACKKKAYEKGFGEIFGKVMAMAQAIVDEGAVKFKVHPKQCYTAGLAIHSTGTRVYSQLK